MNTILTIAQMVSMECDILLSSSTKENRTCLVLSMMNAALLANPVSLLITLK